MKDIRKIFTVLGNEQVGPKTYAMALSGDASALSRPGQFVNIKIDGKFLRRPISVCDYADDRLLLLYDVVGDGTEAMSQFLPGDMVDMLLPLGNGFDTSKSGEHPLLLGGGIGVAPLYRLAKALKEEGKHPTVILGFNTADFIVWQREFEEICPTYVATVDGSAGVKGFVTDAIREKDLDGSFYYACGPLPMLKALSTSLLMRGELSLDERMACGFGVCMCCSLQTKSGAKRICKDGPVFDNDELIWL